MPARMDDHDRFDLATYDADRVYALLAGLVTPRPIAWVTTVDTLGRINAAPFSFFNLLGAEPPVVALGIGDRDDGRPKDTALNIAATEEFVVNLVDEPLAAAMNLTAAPLPHGESELARTGLRTTPSERVRAPRIADAPASLECRRVQTLRIGGNRILFGEVVFAHVRAGVADPATLRVTPGAHRPIGRLESPVGYCRTTDRFAMTRPE